MAKPQSKPTLRVTRDYSLFVQSKDNRPTELSGRKALMDSMRLYGYLPAYPIHCVRARDGKLEIRDGQHRFAIAQKLGLQVWFVVLDDDANIAVINKGQKPWNPNNYAKCYATQGNSDYAELLEFHQQYGIPVTHAAAMLSGTVSWTNARKSFESGSFKVKSRETAHRVGGIYAALVALNKTVGNVRLIDAIFAVCQVPGIDLARLTDGARRVPERLVAYSTREAYLAMLEELYNFGRRVRVPLRIPAENAMRARNPVRPNRDLTTSRN